MFLLGVELNDEMQVYVGDFVGYFYAGGRQILRPICVTIRQNAGDLVGLKVRYEI